MTPLSGTSAGTCDIPLTSVRDRSYAIAGFRHICIRLMETVAGWTPTTREMEVKLLFGRQIWDYAQMADALGKRVFEMRQPLHFTRAPVAEYDQLLNDLAAMTATADRVTALGAIQAGLENRLNAYQGRVDPILDQPSTVIVASMVRELARQRQDGEALARALGLVATDLVDDLRAREQAVMFLIPESELA
jgi:hypothetical protein